jgi:beta-phosphoglucomutase
MSDLAVIFDMDGVLVDSYDAHYRSWLRLYGALGIEYSEVRFAKDFGRTGRDILHRTLGRDVSDAEFRELDGRKEAFYRDIIRENFPAMDGAEDLIDALSDVGFHLAIGSSGPPENVQLVLEKLRNGRRFSATVNGFDVTRGKPDPQVFLKAAERLKMSPKSCAVVEDAVHGVEAAKRAGMTAIALIGTSTRDELAVADLAVESLRDLSPTRVANLIERAGQRN